MRSFDEWFDENCDGSDLAKDACRKLWDEFSDQINIICRKSYEKQQSKVDELQKQKSLQELEINQIAQANQQWQLKCDELQKRVYAAKQLIEDLNKCYQQDHQNKFEYWRGFADSAGILGKRLEQALKGDQ